MFVCCVRLCSIIVCGLFVSMLSRWKLILIDWMLEWIFLLGLLEVVLLVLELVRLLLGSRLVGMGSGCVKM